MEKQDELTKFNPSEIVAFLQQLLFIFSKIAVEIGGFIIAEIYWGLMWFDSLSQVSQFSLLLDIELTQTYQIFKNINKHILS